MKDIKSVFFQITVLILLTAAVWGCTKRSPVLNPMPGTYPGPAGEEQLKVSIRPIVTSGYGSVDRETFGIDLSAYFTAFHVVIINQLPRKVWLDATRVVLEYNGQETTEAFSEEEAIHYYRFGDGPRPALTLIPKSRKLEKMEIAKIRELRLKSAMLPSGSRHAGVVYFKKLESRGCDQAMLRIQDIQIEDESDPQQVQFRFDCNDQ